MSHYIDSYYTDSANEICEYDALKDHHTVDVCVVGAGYTGLSTALHLAEKGYSVVVLEAERVGWGASGRNGGHVGTGQRKGQDELEAMLGLDRAKEFWQCGLDAVELVEALINKHHIDCDLKRGILHVAAKEKHADYFRDDVDHLTNEYGYSGSRYCDKDEVAAMVGSKRFYGGMLDGQSLHLHPLNFVLGMADAARKAGVKIYENSRVVDIHKGVPAVVITEQGQVTANTVVMGCNGYLGKLEKSIAKKIMPINNFVIATEPLSEDQAKQLIRDDVAVQDSLFVINYWKLSGDNRLIFGGGENYSPKFPKDIKNFVRKYMLSIYPQLEDTQVDYGWGGTLAITIKRMPHFERLGSNIYVAHGYSGHGVPTATYAGKTIADAIDGDARRFDLFASVPAVKFPGGTLLRWPGMVAGMSYYALRDKF